MHKIDFGFISKLEGGQRLDGYVPAVSTSQSGVTIATGFDLGARNLVDLRNLGLSQPIINKLSPYLGKKTTVAKTYLGQHPLKITKAEADVIDAASKKSAADKLVQRYDQVVATKPGLTRFAQLFAEAQTVMASVSFQYGDLASRTPKFWQQVTAQRWQAAISELRNFGDQYKSRRTSEANLLETGLKRGNDAPVIVAGFTSLFELLRSKFDEAKKTIDGSVGKNGRNAPDDVRLIQRLVNQHIRVPMMPVAVNGVVDPTFIKAIMDFQRRVVGLSSPDGRVDPGGRTFRALSATARTETEPKKGNGKYCFPFPEVTKYSWETGARAFGSNRSGGTRAHGGCDLYYPSGTVIHAVGDGKVIRGPYEFYCSTYALEVDHGDFVVRYGEIQGKALVKTGDTVTMGQKIARVGHLVGITVESDMLHMEMFDGSATGALSDKTAGGAKRRDGVPFYRRRDLVDPTPFLNEWKGSLPSA